MITIKCKGDYKKANRFLEKLLEIAKLGELDKYGRMGVDALKSSTPVDSGETANSWVYSIERSGKRVSIVWSNTNVNDGVNIALILQLGHGTGTGGYVQGVDYVNPALKPVFDEISENIWKEVKSL
jgi:hypothetical protein